MNTSLKELFNKIAKEQLDKRLSILESNSILQLNILKESSDKINVTLENNKNYSDHSKLLNNESDTSKSLNSTMTRSIITTKGRIKLAASKTPLKDKNLNLKKNQNLNKTKDKDKETLKQTQNLKQTKNINNNICKTPINKHRTNDVQLLKSGKNINSY